MLAFLFCSGGCIKTEGTIDHSSLSTSEHITIKQERLSQKASSSDNAPPHKDNVTEKYNIEECGSICLPVKNL